MSAYYLLHIITLLFRVDQDNRAQKKLITSVRTLKARCTMSTILPWLTVSIRRRFPVIATHTLKKLKMSIKVKIEQYSDGVPLWRTVLRVFLIAIQITFVLWFGQKGYMFFYQGF